MDVEFVTLDVFTTTVFGGNPLAVFPDARGLSDAQLQAITAEFNYSESTFVLPSEDPAATARVRIFTPFHEIPFAGHPNIGTAIALARAGQVFGRPVRDRLRFEEQVGLVNIDILTHDGSPTGARFMAPGEIGCGPMFEESAIAETIDLSGREIRCDRHMPRLASLGVGFVFAEVDGPATLARCAPVTDRFRTHLPAELAQGLCVYARTGEPPDLHVRARVFAPLEGIAEDPATGSAAAVLGALLAGVEDVVGRLSITVVQGIEMGRPGRIDVNVERDSAGSSIVHVSGNAVPVMRGTLSL